MLKALRNGGEKMSKLSIAPRAKDDARIGGFLDRQKRRVDAMPPGMCPIAQQLALLEEGALQTCGKCVPCRDGLPQLAAMMRRVIDCAADAAELDRMRELATMIRDTSDCAIGYAAADAVLEGMDVFAVEYESHVCKHACQQGVGQSVPCETLCPAHVNVPAYIALVAQGDNAGAVAMVRKDNPFPTACALVCEHPCEARCRRTIIDAPVNIRGIKQYACEHARADKVPVPKRAPETGRRIAVVGGGPSGLTCAYFAALMGHDVDVFESRAQLGGMMRYGIPAYRFPRERLDEDVNAILSVGGIAVHTQAPIDSARMAELSRDYDAVYVAIGAQVGKTLRIDGTDAEGVFSAVDLLGRIGDGDYPDFTGKRVVVVGGGNVAMDCARTAVRAGAAEVSVVYRRRVSDMTALPAEIESAIAEGVEMVTLQSPAAIEKDDAGRVAALITQPQMIGAVKRGRPAPVAADKPEMRIPADVVLIAVGQNIVSGPFEEFGMEAEWGQFKADDHLKAVMKGAGSPDAEDVDAVTGASLDADGGPADPNVLGDNVFVGGDCQTGPSTVIRAIGAGKVAARNIDEMLGFHHTLDCGVEVPAARENDRTPCGRVEVIERPARERRNDYEGVEIVMSEEEALQECGRCLRCDHFGAGACVGGRIQYA